jgi:transposase
VYLRRCFRNKDGKRHAYWALVESYRTACGPRQRVVAWLGELDAAGRMAVAEQAAGQQQRQAHLFDDAEPAWVEVDAAGVRVEAAREFGGAWLGLRLAEELGLIDFLREAMARGREQVPWPMMALVLVLGRLCDRSSELHLAERGYQASALPELLGVPVEKVNEDRLYRALDALLPHKAGLQKHLKQRMGELFRLEYDLLLYDVTSTYFEGEAAKNPQARRGYSRDHRPDCKQVNIALVVSREGVPLGYEIFDGNRADVTTVEQIVETIEAQYGRADRIWVMDRGMVSEHNVEFLKRGRRRYILGTARSNLRRFEKELLGGAWQQIREGLEVQLCPAPGGEEVFILCRSQQRREKEQAMQARFEKRIAEGLAHIAESCRRRKQTEVDLVWRIARLMAHNTRAAGLFEVSTRTDEQGAAQLIWRRKTEWRDWARLSQGCYLLRSNVSDWTGEELWRAYIQLTEAEAAFRIHKSELSLRPIWHQRQDRVAAHILVCFLTYVLWKTLALWCERAGLGSDPRKVFEELRQIQLVDVVLPTRQGVVLRKRCVTRPSQHQAILLQRLGLHLPSTIGTLEM